MLDATRRAVGSPRAQRMDRRPIIVAVGAGKADSALRLGRAIATRNASDLVIASIVEPALFRAFEPRQVPLVPWAIQQALGDRRQRVQERLHRLGWAADVNGAPVIEVLYGDIASGIADLARARGARLIVVQMGPHALLRRLLATGTALATSRRAPCPVLAVSERAHHLPRIAVVATDLSPESIHAVQQALPLLADDAVVHLVHALTRNENVASSGDLPAPTDAYAASLSERFDLLLGALGGVGSLVFDSIALAGNPAEVVLSVARDTRADLIVAGTHGYGRLHRWLLGSTSTALLHGAECSMLLVPPPGVAEHGQPLRHMTGTSTLRAPEDCDAELPSFGRRNIDRRTTVEIEDGRAAPRSSPTFADRAVTL